MFMKNIRNSNSSRPVLYLGRFMVCLAVIGSTATVTQAQELNHESSNKASKVFQFSTLPALSLGLFDGELSFGELLKHGDFGIGTFDALDGELIILDGKAWRVRVDGSVTRVEKKETTPFALVTRFSPNQTLKVDEPQTISALQRRIASALPSVNTAYAIEIKGTLARIKVRSVPKQNKPYRSLGDAVKTQTEWEWKNLKGTLVGFQFPAYLSGINLPDPHFHFISDDKRYGGHVLDFELKKGEVRIQPLRDVELKLPVSDSFARANLSTDQSATLKAAEKAGSN
jgi:acetolactate decarboxylase